jgi:hypothetical protein
MNMPGLTAEASLGRPSGHYSGRRTTLVNGHAVLPQGETCDYGYLGEGHDLYLVCCDPERNPPCEAYGIV